MRFNIPYEVGVNISPKISMFPEVGFQRLVIIFITVVLPAPLGPKKP